MEIQEEINSIKAELAELRPRLNKIQLKGVRRAILYLNLQKKADEIKQQIADDQVELQLARTYTRLRRRLVELKRQLHKQSPPWFAVQHRIPKLDLTETLEAMSEEEKIKLQEVLQTI